MTTVHSVTVGAPEAQDCDDASQILSTATDPNQFGLNGRPVKETDLVRYKGIQMRVSAAVEAGLLTKSPDGTYTPVSEAEFQEFQKPAPRALMIEGPASEKAAQAALSGMSPDQQMGVLVEVIQASVGEDASIFEDQGTISHKAAKYASENGLDIVKAQKALKTYATDLHQQALQVAQRAGVQNVEKFIEWAAAPSQRSTLTQALIRLGYSGSPDGVQYLAKQYLTFKGHEDHNAKTKRDIGGPEYVEVNGRRTSPGAARLAGLIR